MADDRMKNDDDLQRNMGKAGEGQNYGQQSPGRGGQEDQEHGGKHTGGQQGQGGYGGSQNKPQNLDDEDEFGGGNAGQSGRGGQGMGQGRGGQNR
ncbi:MAG TPA: hypothetical protein VFY60_04970 [Pyrinomonadaceae bacterium]|nr:hypothetical protein [Pyrinomonadaceae bacterium]